MRRVGVNFALSSCPWIQLILDHLPKWVDAQWPQPCQLHVLPFIFLSSLTSDQVPCACLSFLFFSPLCRLHLPKLHKVAPETALTEVSFLAWKSLHLMGPPISTGGGGVAQETKQGPVPGPAFRWEGLPRYPRVDAAHQPL